MIRSMTGYGTTQRAVDGVSYSVELRSVNNRYLKLATKVPEWLTHTETLVEKLVRKRLSRGSVTCSLRVKSEEGTEIGTLNLPAIKRYVDQLGAIELPSGVSATLDLAVLAAMPGMCDMPTPDEQTRTSQAAFVQQLVSEALDGLVAMRTEEGRALHEDLKVCCEKIREELSGISQRAPVVITEYHEKLRNRVTTLLASGAFELEQDALMREVAVFADRCDISEELARLDSHLSQFLETCKRDEPVGRTLDFLTQELLREANTIASKSNDAAIARHTVEIKRQIDRLKEQVQNVE